MSEEEQAYYVKFINTNLSEAEDLAYYGLPISTEGTELYDKLRDGVLLCKLLNLAVEDCTDERAINKPSGKPLGPWQINENLDLVLNSAKAIGCKVVNIGPEDIVEGKPHMVLALLGQVLRIHLLSQISVREIPELVVLLEKDEELPDLLKLPPEKILLRWFNHHLNNSGQWDKPPVANFSGDIRDSAGYLVLLHQLDAKCGTDALGSEDMEARAAAVLSNSEVIGHVPLINTGSIVSGNAKLNLAFVANLFHTRHGLVIPEDKQVEMAGLLEEEPAATREERCLVAWLNSLGCEEHCNDLCEDTADGVLLLQAMNILKRGSVVAKRVNKRPVKMKIKQHENCNYFFDLCKDIGLKLMGIGGTDIVDKNRKLVTSLLWQLMRYHIMSLLGSGTGTEVTEQDLIQWMNSKLTTFNSPRFVKNFKDKALGDGLAFLDLLAGLQPGILNPDFVFDPPKDDKDREMNAKYVISVARKIGCSIFLTWEDIVEAKSKMLAILAASIMDSSGTVVARRERAASSMCM